MRLAVLLSIVVWLIVGGIVALAAHAATGTRTVHAICLASSKRDSVERFRCTLTLPVSAKPMPWGAVVVEMPR